MGDRAGERHRLAIDDGQPSGRRRGRFVDRVRLDRDDHQRAVEVPTECLGMGDNVIVVPGPAEEQVVNEVGAMAFFHRRHGLFAG